MSLFEKRVEAGARVLRERLFPGVDLPLGDSAWAGHAREVLLAADAVVTEEMIAEVPSRDDIIDALVMTDLSDYAGTDMGLIEQAADRVLALLRGGAK